MDSFPSTGCNHARLALGHNPYRSPLCAKTDVLRADKFWLAAGKAEAKSSELHDLIWADYDAAQKEVDDAEAALYLARRVLEAAEDRKRRAMHVVSKIRRLSSLAKARVGNSREMASWARVHRGAAKTIKDHAIQAEAARRGERDEVRDSGLAGIEEPSQSTPRADTCTTPGFGQGGVTPSKAPAVAATRTQETPSTTTQANSNAAKPSNGTTRPRMKLPDGVSSSKKTISTSVKLPDAAGQRDPQLQPDPAVCVPAQAEPSKPPQSEPLKQGEKRIPSGPPSPERAVKRERSATPEAEAPVSVKVQRPSNIKVEPGTRTELWTRSYFLS